jgi:hypothetical protein
MIFLAMGPFTGSTILLQQLLDTLPGTQHDTGLELLERN